MPDTPLIWNMPLSHRPQAALMVLGKHGPNMTECFRSEHFWWLHLYRYTATLRLDGQAFALRPGCASLIAPGTDIEYDFGERATHLCAHFRLPPAAEADCILLPAVQDLGEAFPAVYDSLEEGVTCFADNPLRAEVRLWDILWRLAQPRQENPLLPWHAHPSPVVRARQIVELRLGETLSVKDLAGEVDVSHNHLTRLFRQAVGTTVIGYIRARRVERARHLLAHTTLPIKIIAAQVGIEDPRQFYKLIRAHLGLSPSQVRQVGHDERERLR